MDWHKLQQTLFALDPTDPREDLAKLRAQAQGGSRVVEPTKDYVAESVEVPQGSMPLGIDSIADFAALAGVRLDERQKHADKVRGSEPMPKAKAGRTEHPFKDRLVGEEEIEEGPFDFAKDLGNVAKAGYAAGKASPAGFDAAKSAYKGERDPQDNKPTSQNNDSGKLKGNVTPQQLNKILNVSNEMAFIQAIQKSKQPGNQKLSLPQQSALAEAFVKLMEMDPQNTQKVFMLLKRMETSEAQEMPKPRDPSSKTMQNLRKSGAMGAHKDKKKVLPRKEKHKSKQYESIKDMLYRKLADKK